MLSTVIIAEAGVNHNGDFDMARKMVEVATDAGAEYVKFQSFKASKLVSVHARKAAYQARNVGGSDDSQFNMLKALEMPESWHYDLIDYCKELGISFLSTGFDEESVDFLETLNLSMFKIPSGEITNKPYLVHIARKQKPVVLSTGMANMAEIGNAINIFKGQNFDLDKLTVLHCNTEYPTPMEDVNLQAMLAIKEEFGVRVGYSDHTLGIEVPIAAVAMGASVIEKHFTLDRNLAGPDHKASLEPKELKAMVSAIRNIEEAISGSGLKEPSKSELKNIDIARKSIHLSRDVAAGTQLEPRDLIMLRPGDGISPMEVESVVGKTLVNHLAAGHKLTSSDIS